MRPKLSKWAQNGQERALRRGKGTKGTKKEANRGVPAVKTYALWEVKNKPKSDKKKSV